MKTYEQHAQAADDAWSEPKSPAFASDDTDPRIVAWWLDDKGSHPITETPALKFYAEIFK
jgi:hypothetical protein